MGDLWPCVCVEHPRCQLPPSHVNRGQDRETRPLRLIHHHSSPDRAGDPELTKARKDRTHKNVYSRNSPGCLMGCMNCTDSKPQWNISGQCTSFVPVPDGGLHDF